MKIKYVKKGERIALPLEGRAGWKIVDLDEDSILISLTPEEQITGGLLIPVFKIIEKIEKNI